MGTQVGTEGGKAGQCHAGFALHPLDEQGGQLADLKLLRIVPVLFARGSLQIPLQIGRFARRQAHTQRALNREQQRRRIPPCGVTRPFGRQRAAAHLPGKQRQVQHERNERAVAEHKAPAALKALQHTRNGLHILPVEQVERRAALTAFKELLPVHLGQLRP